MSTYSKLATQLKQEGEQIGIQKGEQIGIQKGEQFGIQKKQVDVVLKSHDNGISIELISNITNLSEDKVIAILKEHGRDV